MDQDGAMNSGLFVKIVKVEEMDEKMKDDERIPERHLMNRCFISINSEEIQNIKKLKDS